ESEVGEFILRALGKGAVVPVINALCGANSRVTRRRLVNVLVSIGTPAVPWAIRMLDDQRWFVVRNMVTVLGGVGSAEAIKALLRLTGDPDSRIRKEVARALGRSRTARVEEPLLVLLEDRDPGVRQMAVSASAAHGSPRVLDGVWRAYQRVPINRAHWELKVVALHAVARMGLEEAEGRLLRELQRRHWFSRERWRRVRVAAAQALGKVGGAAASPVLERCVRRGEPELRAAAERSLAALVRRTGGGL
ncbi:MAG TPA: HEAT repeat domain-containing protein, partial [Deferrisomatales bacterium]|nr:HEAT repeat domain-containing protein [Deferrisomatales bacterium]